MQQVRRHAELVSRLASASDVVGIRLNAHLQSVSDLGIFLSAQDRPPDEASFGRVCQAMLRDHPQTFALEYADADNILRFIHPLKGNEDAIDLDLNSRPAAPYIEKAKSTRQLTIAPHFRTVQGRDSVIARYPIYQADHYRGLVAGLIDLQEIKKQVANSLDGSIDFCLIDEYGDAIAGVSSPSAANRAQTPLIIGDATWTLHGWYREPLPFSIMAATIIWCGLGLILFLALRVYALTQKKHEWLREQVAKRTQELTDRNRQLDSALGRADSLARFHEKVLDSSLVMVCVTDFKGRVSLWNKGAANITGYTWEEVKGGLNVWHELYTVEGFNKMMERGASQFQAAGKLEGFETTIRDRQGNLHEMSWYASRLQDAPNDSFLCIGTDITQQKQAISQLAESEERFRLIFDQASVGLILTGPTGTFQRVNQALCDLLGYTREEILQLSVGALTHPDDRTRDLDALASMNSGQLEIYRAEKRYLRKDGSTVWGDITVSTLRDENHQTKFHIAAIIDINERKLQEFELRRTRSELQESLTALKETQQQVVHQERMRALGSMASGIAHDFNNSLAVITGFTDLLKMKLPTSQEEFHRYVGRIATAASDAAFTVSRMREFYRKRDEDQEPLEPVRLNDLIPEVISLTEPRWRRQEMAKGIDIRIKTDLQAIPPLQANPSELRELILNLILNAVDAMPDGGTITCSTRTEGDQIFLSIADTGLGMDETTRKRCCEPFFTTKGKQGTGLGLAMAHGIMDRHDGQIEIDSKIGAGTTIHLIFPLSCNLADSPEAPAIVPTVRRQAKILLAEDEEHVREVITEILSLYGHTIHSEPSGLAALAYLEKESVDLVITDRAMPGMTGDELAERLAERIPELPIIMLTGFGALMQDSHETPFNIRLVLSKPVIASKLEAAVNAVLSSP